MRGGWRLGAVLCATLLWAAPASAVVSGTPLSQGWVTNGKVNALTQLGSKVYLGGEFSFVGPMTGAGALLDESKAGYGAGAPSLQPGFPLVDGPILAVVGDGSGGFYIGGSFTKVGGVSQPSLAHVKSNNQVDTTFKPAIHPLSLGYVSALAMSGTQLLAGGSFNSVDGVENDSITSLNPTTGAVSAGWTHSPFGVGVDGTLSAIAVSGSDVYVGGQFLFQLNGDGNSTTVTNLASLKLSDGTPDTFHPPIGDSSTGIRAMQTVSIGGNAALLVGGDFQTPHTDLTAIKISDGSDIVLSAYPDGAVDAIAYSSGSAWIGGGFTHVGVSTNRDGLAKYELPTLDAFWNPSATDGAVRSLALLGSELVFGGDFTNVAGGSTLMNLVSSHPHIAAVAASASTVFFHDSPLASWNPGTGASVDALGVRGAATVLAGGFFSSADGLARRRIAALDLPLGTGDVNFNQADADATVWALQSNGTRLYAGGSFSTIGGQASPSIAQLDPSTGALATGFASALTSGIVEALAFSADGTKIYAGGLALSGPDANLNAFNATTGALLPGAAPGADGPVVRLLTNGNTVYVAGRFTQLGGAAHPHLGAFGSSSGAVIGSFAPSVAGDAVMALALAGSRLYIGGQFVTVGGAPRRQIAAVNPSTGAVDNGWHANLDGGVVGLAVLGNHLYAAGGFQNAGPSDQRFGLAAFSLTDGGLSPDFHPQLTGDAQAITGEGASAAARGHALLPVGNTLFAGTDAQRVDGALRPGLALFAFATPTAGAPGPKVLGSPWPGQRLACSIGGFSGAESYSFSWLRDGKVISGAHSQTFTPGVGHVGHRISCRVTAVNPAGVGSATSSAVKISLRPGGPRMRIAKSARASGTGVLLIKVTCPRGFTLCAGRLSVSLKGKGLGGGSFTLHGARSAMIQITLSSAELAQLRKKHSLKASARAKAHDASSRYATVSASLKLLAPGHRRRHR